MDHLITGLGLKSCHFADVLDTRPALSFFEVHAENYMGAGGPTHRWLSAISEHYPLSIHGVGLSLGTDGPLDPEHLTALAQVVERYQPILVSEHLAWSRIDGTYLNDLLPIPYTEETLRLVVDHVDQTQEKLGRTILIENPSATFSYVGSEMTEWEFLAQLGQRSGCKILLDINNIYVSARNLGFDPKRYLTELKTGLVGQYHLAGHHVRTVGDKQILIDDHGAAVCDAVWELYDLALHRFGRHPATLERDCNIPSLATLMDEVHVAERLAQTGGQTHARAS